MLEYGKGLREYSGSSYPVFGTNGQIGWHDVPLCKEPGIIIGRKGAYRGVHYSKQPFFVIDTAFFLKPKTKDFDIKWAYYQLLDFDVNNIDSGSAIPSTSREAFYAIPVRLPPLPTQQKIASILSFYDDLIKNNLRRIKILEEMAKTIYEEWFVKFRFPGHEKAKMVESELGMIPEGWEVKNLSEIVSTQYGYTESATETEVGPKFLRGMDINKNSYIQWDAVPYCPINAEDFKRYKLSTGDILIIRMADPGKIGIVEKEIDSIFASYLIRIKIKSTLLSPHYLFYFLSSNRYQAYITGASTGTTRKSASAGVITNIKIVVPIDSIREEFEGWSVTLRQMLNNLLDKNAILRQTRDLLLPKLISSEIDVKNLDIQTGGPDEPDI
jgi:type I restriction enzyme S subunit